MLEFKTKKENRYMWDEKTSLCLFFPEPLKIIHQMFIKNKEITEKMILDELKGNFEEEEIIFYFNWFKKWEKLEILKSSSIISPKENDKISKDNLKQCILKNGLKTLLLNVTDECNFKCKYCIFSGKYKDRRNHSKKYMKFKTAKDAIDYYFSLAMEGMKYNPVRIPNVGFYGGEPLLNFKLIKKSVKYIEKTYSHEFNNVTYSLTTNGSLLTESIIKWLIKHDFFIGVSLDGPKEENDRCRVYEDGTGTFKDVMPNISKIKKLEYKKFGLLSVYDLKSDLFKREKFFKTNNLPLVNVSGVDESIENSYFDQFTKEDYSRFEDQIKKTEKYYIENLENCNSEDSLLGHLFSSDTRANLCEIDALNQSHPLIKYSSSCFPGYKIFVATDGTFYLCERVSSSFPIGNATKGLNYPKIIEIIQDYLKHMDKCKHCQTRKRCRYCFKHFEKDKSFRFSSKVCENIESLESGGLTKALDIVEYDPTLIEQYTQYKNIKKHYNDSEKNVFQTES